MWDFVWFIFQGYESEEDKDKEEQCANNAKSVNSSGVPSLVFPCLLLLFHSVKAL